jgi:peptidyl-prolyl cis-trans isomerase NIMA-interacting 1
MCFLGLFRPSQKEDPPLRLPKGWGTSRSKRSDRLYFYQLDNPKLSQYEAPTEPPKGAGEEVEEEEEERVFVRHLLVKHRGSRNPSSWREKNVTRTKEEALELLNGVCLERKHFALLCFALLCFEA